MKTAPELIWITLEEFDRIPERIRKLLSFTLVYALDGPFYLVREKYENENL